MPRSFKWAALASLVALPVLAPLLVVIFGAFDPAPDIWQHLKEFVLPELLQNSVLLAIGVCLTSLFTGVSLGWLTTMSEYPGRRFFSIALVLPLACPAYVLGFVHIGIWDFTGPVQTWLRDHSINALYFPRIRSFGGLIFVLSLSLYPYFYLLARSAFQTHGRRMTEAAQSLGLSRTQAFYRVIIPMSRPWLAGGALLVVMETLADFGTVSLFNVDTFTTAIYKSWFSLFSLPTAQLLAALLGGFMLLLIVSEPLLRGDRLYTSARAIEAAASNRLHGWKALAAVLFSSVVVFLGIGAPLIQLVYWIIENWADIWDSRYIGFILHTVLIGFLAASCITVLALILGLAQRRLPRLSGLLITRLACIGYAIPGTVLAVGLFIPFSMMDKLLNDAFGRSDFMLRSSLFALISAFIARFLAVGFQPLSASLARISSSLEEVAHALGSYGLNRLRRVHLPLLKGGMLTALLMTAVDVMKEMPITLMMRPFGWETLSVRIFELTSEGQWELAAFPALLLVAVGIVPVTILIRTMEHR